MSRKRSFPSDSQPLNGVQERCSQAPPLLFTQVNCLHLCSHGWLSPCLRWSIRPTLSQVTNQDHRPQPKVILSDMNVQLGWEGRIKYTQCLGLFNCYFCLLESVLFSSPPSYSCPFFVSLYSGLNSCVKWGIKERQYPNIPKNSWSCLGVVGTGNAWTLSMTALGST